MKLLKKIIETELFNDKKLGGTPIWEQNTANRPLASGQIKTQRGSRFS
jgi:hypothetical protein